MHTYYFEKLDVWKGAKELAILIYGITESFPQIEKYVLSDQLRRSALSISANIAEGSTRESGKEQSRFMNIAYGSSIEVLNHLLIAKDLGYVQEENLTIIREKIQKITNQISALNKSIQLKNSKTN
jgi:four helix bundle protein